MRNGLLHMDVSAKTGDGINNLMSELINIGLTRLDQSEGNNQVVSALQRNHELDLHQRYAPKSRNCFQLISFQCCGKR
jgi:hypothetical protein